MSLPKPTTHVFVARLADRRTALGWTYAVVAERSGLSEGSVNRILRGKTAPMLSSIDALAGALGLSIVMVEEGAL